MYPAQGTAVLVKDLVMMDMPLTQRSTKRPEGIAVDFAARANGTLSNSAHCRSIQFGNLYLEEAGMPLLCEGHCGQCAGFLRPPPRFPFDLGAPK